MSTLRSLVMPLALLSGMSAHAQGMPVQRQERPMTISNRSNQDYTLLAYAPSRNPSLPGPTVVRLGLKVGDSPGDRMVLEVPAGQSRSATLVLEYKWVAGQAILDLGCQLKDKRGDTALWAFTTDGPKVVASEFSAQRALDPRAVKFDGATITIGRDYLGR